MTKKIGKFIVIYGINNLGKSTQARLLVEKLKSEGREAEYLKYPIYSLAPSGPALNEYLRHGNPQKLSPKQAQVLFAENRAQFEPDLKAKLESGIDIVAEDYWGTGVAWGIGAGVDKHFLLKLNNAFLREDLALLFQGKRFVSGFEENHLHEQDSEFTNKVEKIHRELGQEFGWKTIDAGGSIEEVSVRVWNEVAKIM
ncbi:MAG: hypothetical protein Q8R08_03130 [bacterium]|nr:hypothetical protein [bacterium]